MSVATEILPHIPYLRRFSRILSGSQGSGDIHVVSTLEALTADPGLFPRELPVRSALYKVFLALWSSGDGTNKSYRFGPAPTAAERNLERLTPRSRQAFLLRAVEGFSLEDVGAILGVTIEEGLSLIERAGQEIAQQVATNVLIIEDEPIIALDIEAMVEELGHSVTGIARTHREAVEMVKLHNPGLVLADIQLADGSSGLNAVNEILGSVDLPVIFITAYPERLLTGEKPEPAFLITKPFHADAVKAAISQALFFDRKASLKAA